MKRKLLWFGMLSLLCLTTTGILAQTNADAQDNISPALQARIRTLIATLGPDPSRNTCMPNPSLPANQAKEELIAIGKPATLPLCAVLAEKNEWRRGMATEALTEIRDPRALVPLLRALQFDGNITVRGNAAEALGNLGDTSVVPALIHTLQIRDPQAISPANTAGRAAEALGKLGDMRALPSLLALLGSRDAFMTSLPVGITAFPLGAEAAKALGKFGTPAAEPLMQMLNHANKAIRTDAIRALSVMKERRAVPLLLRCLSADKELKSEEWNPFEDANVNSAAIDALGEIGDKQATLPLLEKLDVPNLQNATVVERFRFRLIEALGKINDPQAVPALLPLLSAKDSYLRQTTLIALSHIRTPEVVEPLLDALQREKEYNVRSEIMKALGEMKEKRALPALQKALKEENIRDEAAVAIGRIDSGLLLSLLQDEDVDVRRAVVHGLGEVGDEQAVPILLTLIRDKELNTRALLALGKLGTPELLPILEPMMREPKNSNPWAARSAVIAIKRRHNL